jgi:hypothetical protein
MEFITWSPAKNEWLKKERKICFEDIVLRINTGNILAVVEHPNQQKYPNQKQMIINVDGYAFVVPFVLEDKGIFLKTIIPSRKFTKQYMKEE